jgi:hypothetical protein
MIASGVELDAPTVDVVALMVALASGTLNESGFAAWLRQRRRG